MSRCRKFAKKINEYENKFLNMLVEFIHQNNSEIVKSILFKSMSVVTYNSPFGYKDVQGRLTDGRSKKRKEKNTRSWVVMFIESNDLLPTCSPCRRQKFPTPQRRNRQKPGRLQTWRQRLSICACFGCSHCNVIATSPLVPYHFYEKKSSII